MKAAKIIATCFAKRSFRSNTYLTGDPLGFFGHSQKFQNEDDIINLLKFNISLEKKINPGINYRDIIIVNNDVGNKKGNNFLKKLSSKKIPFGKIIVCNRKNTGMSFGAYNYAFKKFKNKYDYFLFSEDDIIICKKNYFQIGIDIFNSNKNSGFFHLFQYETEKLDLVKSLETELKRDRSILRYLTVSLCKDALEYNARRAKGEFKKKKK